MSTNASSGDLLADRRYAWAAAALAERDFAAAADLLRQTLERVPDWAPAHAALGDALAGLCERAAAADAYACAARLDSAGVLGAELKRAALGLAPAPDAAPRDYVRALFDDYAPRFDDHLRNALAYRGPEILMDALARACEALGRPLRFARVFDLGCGSGLMGAPLAAVADVIVGVDLSPAMIDLARRGGLYADLRVGDVVDALQDEGVGAVDLAIAADVFVYMGDLAPVFSAAARVLAPGGLLAFTVQRGEGADWALGSDLRYAHTAAYLSALARAHGFAVALIEDASTRRDAGSDVPGLVGVLVRA